MMQRLLSVIFCVILFVLVLSAYCNTFYSPPVLDDYHSFIEDESVYLKDLSVTSLISISNTKFGWGRWIPMMTFALDHRLGKGEIFYFHLTNFALHIFCTFAVLFLVFQVLQASRKQDHTFGVVPPIYCAIWIAGLWALNPVQTNAVTYIVQRMASIQSLFYVLSVSLYMLARRKYPFHQNRLKALFFYISSLFAAVCAFLSKQNAAMLPVMLVVTEVWFFQPQLFPSLWLKIKKSNKVVWGILSLGFFCGVMFAVKFLAIIDGGYATRNFTMLERLLSESRVVVWYLTILILPLPSRLSIEHDINISTSLLEPPTTLLSIIFLCLVFCLSIRFRKKFPLITYGSIWFFTNLAIESTIIGLELVFEHRLYLPSIGFYIAVVVAIVQIFNFRLNKLSKSDLSKVLWSVFAIMAACNCLLTFQRNEAWKDFLTFNQDVVSKAPMNSRAHSNLAVALAKVQRYQEAIQEAETAIKMGYNHNEQYIVSANVIVGSLIGLGNFEKAAERGEELLTRRPEPCDAGALPVFCLQIAEAYRSMGKLSKACSFALLSMEYGQKLGGPNYEKKLLEGMLRSILIEANRKSIDLNADGQLDPGSVPISTWIAKAFLNFGGRKEAKKLLETASLENPSDPGTQSLLESLIQEDDRNEIQAYKGNFSEKYVKSPFSSFDTSMGLSYLIREHRMPSLFLQVGESLINYAVYLKPDAADAHLLKGWYHFENEETSQAVDCARRALWLDPQYAKAYLGLGFFLLRANEHQEAIAAFQRALELFPGYPKRKVLLDLIAEIEQGVENLHEKISKVDK